MLEQVSEDSMEVANLYHASSPSYILEFPDEVEMTDTTTLVKQKKKVRFNLPEEVHSCYREGPNCYLKPTLIFLLIVALSAGLISVSIQSGQFNHPSDTSFDSSAANVGSGSSSSDAVLPSPIETPDPIETRAKQRGLWLTSTIEKDDNETMTDIFVVIEMLEVDFIVASLESVDKEVVTELGRQTGVRIVLITTTFDNGTNHAQNCLTTDGCDEVLLDVSAETFSQEQETALQLFSDAVSKFLPVSLRADGEFLSGSSTAVQQFNDFYVVEDDIFDSLGNYFVEILYKNFEESKAEAQRLESKLESDERFQGVYFQY